MFQINAAIARPLTDLTEVNAFQTNCHGLMYTSALKQLKQALCEDYQVLSLYTDVAESVTQKSDYCGLPISHN